MLREGFFEKYFINPLIRDFKNKKEEFIPQQSMPFILTAWGLITIGLFGILIGQVGMLGPEVGFAMIYIIVPIWIIASILPLISVIKRARRDPEPKKLSAEEYYETIKKTMLPLDWILSGAALLFFIFGPIMMESTLRGRNLDILPRGNGDSGVSLLDTDSVYEEPIFNFQVGENEGEQVDTLGSLEDLDTVSFKDSYDPYVEAAIDSISE